MFCYSCGAELPEGAHFCPKCGQSCTVKTDSETKENFTFEDELRPISDALPRPAKKEPSFNTSAEPHGRSRKISASNAPLNNGSSAWRVLNENGSGNTSMEFFDDTLFAVAFIPDGDTLRMPLMADGKMIVSGPVGAFHIGRKIKLIFYLTEKNELMACDFHGNNIRKIAGGNGDQVLDFVVNDDQLFVLLQGKNSNASIFQLSQSLDTGNVLKKGDRLRGLAADQDFLYYIEGTSLKQYDLKTGSEKVILNRTGINTFQLYNGHLVLTVSDNLFSKHDMDNQILLIDPIRMLQRTVAQVAAKNVNCYWDHVFYTDIKSECVWTVPLTGGAPHMLRNKAADLLNLACGHLYFVDCARVEFVSINLCSGEERSANSEEMPKAASEAIEYSLLHQKAEHYKGYTLNRALLEGVSDLQEFNSKSELFDYVVFLTLPQLNKKKADIPALLKAAGYQQKLGSEPIVFVDATTFHNRSKGFIVATDGIYTHKTFFPYDYTFSCDREGGPQNIRLRTYEKLRFGKEKRTLDINCPMFKSGLEYLAELIYTVYAFAYFMTPPSSDGYLLPIPKDLSGNKQPEYIKAPKKSANEDKKISENVTKSTADQSGSKSEQASEDNRSTEEIKEAKEKEYTVEMDQLWQGKSLLLYNFIKVLFTFLCFFFSECAFGLANANWIVGIIAFIVFAFGFAYAGTMVKTSMEGAEGEAIEKRYKAMGVTTVYTPAGIRGIKYLIVVVACFWLALPCAGTLLRILHLV